MSKYRIVQDKVGLGVHLEYRSLPWLPWRTVYSASSVDTLRRVVETHKTHGVFAYQVIPV